MLSILIPTYNYNVVSLVEELNKQCIASGIDFEILVFDDGSKSELNTINNTINNLNNCIFKALPENIGRSAIRNLLGNHAKYHLLLFIDAGTFPKKENFIKNYIQLKDKSVINGGMTHTEKPPEKPYKLRWSYTKNREQNALCSSNFFIRKEHFKKNFFDESIKQYGYEDVLFFNNLAKKNIKVLKIDNPVIHISDDNATTFLKKTESSIKNLIELNNQGKLSSENYKVISFYKRLKRLELVRFVLFTYKLLKPLLIKNFNSSNPSLFLFDFYKFGYYCTLKSKK